MLRLAELSQDQRAFDTADHGLPGVGAWISHHLRIFRTARAARAVQLVLIIGGTLALVLVKANSNSAPLEATGVMERLTRQLETVRSIPQETRDEILRLLTRTSFDCDQVRCSPQLTQRNRIARDRLQAVLSVPTVSIGDSRAHGDVTQELSAD